MIAYLHGIERKKNQVLAISIHTKSWIIGYRSEGERSVGKERENQETDLK